MKIVPATPEILAEFYGVEQKYTTRAFVAMDGDTPVAVGGLRWFEDCWVGFFIGEIDKRSLVKALRFFPDMIESVNRPILAKCDPNVEGSDVLLKHLGFECHGEIWQCHSR